MWKIEKIISKGDYNYAIVRGHPNATKNGYVLEHRVIMENHLGRLLNSDEVVHHKNKVTKDNRLSNLMLTKNAVHASAHQRDKGRAMVTLRCPECGDLFVRRKGQCFLSKPGTRFTACSRRCRGKFSQKLQLCLETTELEKAISGNLVGEFRVFGDNPEQTL